nr:hypothetical protein [Tanacetum cinerariifolium]
MWEFKECSSCGALYTKSCACLKRGFIDKFVCDPNKTPYSSQRPPHDCPKCGNPIDGLYCRHYALSRKKLKEQKFSKDFLNTSESSNDDSNVVSMPQEPIVFNQDPDENSSQSPPYIDHHCCYGCGDSLDDIFCQRCTYQVCQKILLCYDNDDDEESSTPLRDIIISKLPPCIAITPVLSSESEDERECDVPACDDFTTFSNLLFDADDDFSSSNNESFSDENIPKEIYSNPLFYEEIISINIDLHHFNVESDLIESLLNQDSLIISSSKIDSLLDEFVDELILLKSIPPGINEADCDPEEEICLIDKLLYDNSSHRPSKEFISENSDAAIESFSSSPIPIEDSDSLMEEIDLSFTPDDSMPPGIEDDDYDSEGDILILEELLSNDSLSLPKNESFYFAILSSPRPPAKPPDDYEIEPKSRILTVKVHCMRTRQYLSMGDFVSVRCQRPGHLAARLGYAEMKVATWDDLAFKLNILGWNVKHRNFAKH